MPSRPFVRGLCALAFVATLGLSTTTQARTLEPGKPILFGELGPTFLIDGRLGGSSSFLVVGAGAEYPFDSHLSALGDVVFGLSGSQQLKLRGGARYRITGLDLPLAPYAEGGIVVGRLFDVLGSNLNLYGLRAAAGADYFLTGQLMTGLKLGYELSRTGGPRPVWFNQVELMVTASYVF